MEIKDENVSALDANGNVIKDIDVTVTGTITESKDGKTEVASSLTINLNDSRRCYFQIRRLEAESDSRTGTSYRCSVIEFTMDAT